MKMRKDYPWDFFFKIIFPTLLVIVLFVAAFYAVIFPRYERSMLDRKREMIRELTNSAWSILVDYAGREETGLMTKSRAQQEAILRIESLRYGKEGKDYFWITDLHPHMIVHPYRADLNGKDLRDVEDPTGKRLFSAMVQAVKGADAGYVGYMWQWKDDPTQIVPKLSYVKIFRPWGWIVGTGIYLGDVKTEIAALKGGLWKITWVITLIIAFPLMVILFQSFRIEQRRFAAEREIRDAKEKYEALVEAAAEGTLMISSGEIVYANKILQDMLGYTGPELERIGVGTLCGDDPRVAGVDGTKKFEARLMAKDGRQVAVEFVASTMPLGGGEVQVLKICPVSREKLEFGVRRNKFKSLTDAINIGVFRTTLGRNGRIIEANPATLDILGFPSEKELSEIRILDFFHDKESRKDFLKELLTKKSVKNRIIRLKRSDGVVTTIAVSAVLIPDDAGEPLYYDGVMEDITERIQKEERQENLIAGLQTSSLFLSQPISRFLKDYLQCEIHQSIKEAAALMSANSYNAILVKTEKGDVVGIVTDEDIRKRVVTPGVSPDEPVYHIMSAPMITIPERAMLYEAIALMQEKRISHLGVKNSDGEIASIVDNEELLQVHSYSLIFLKREVEHAETVEKIASIYKRLPLLITSLLNSGADAGNLSRLTAIVFDAVVQRLITLALAAMGPPPANFTFIAMGSAGREEQTLATDQDNAIIFEDVPPERLETVTGYFLSLGRQVSDWLHAVGYHYCPGKIMASTRQWCQPLQQWKKYFSRWISTAEPQDLLDINIFFDFRAVYGENAYTEDLRKHIDETIRNHPAFFVFLTGNIQKHKLPLSLFGNIVVGATKDQPHAFDIKQSMVPIVDMARLYSLKHHVAATNTLTRLKRLYDLDVFTQTEYQDRVAAYKHLLLMRFQRQTELIAADKTANNFVNPEKITRIEQVMLKKIFGQITEFNTKVGLDFKGGV